MAARGSSSVTLVALMASPTGPTGLLVWCAIGFCAGLGLFFYGFRLLQRRRLILDTPFSKIRSASMGMVEVTGLAVGPYTMIAPVTARACYYYRTEVREYKQRGKNKEWVKVAGECMYVPFFVDDNTGRLLVDPRGADLDLHCDFEQEFCDSFFTTKDPAPENVRGFLARHGIVTSNRIKVQEFCIKPKNSLFILGTLGENPGLEVSPRGVPDDENQNSLSMGGFSLSMGSLASRMGVTDDDLRLDAAVSRPSPRLPVEVIQLSPERAPTAAAEMSHQQKIAAALMKAGISNPAAWAAAGVPAAGAAQETEVVAAASTSQAGNGGNGNCGATGTEDGFERRPAVVLTRGTNNKTFLISWRSQQDVARSLGWKSVLMIWGGPALALVCLYFLLNMRVF